MPVFISPSMRGRSIVDNKSVLLVDDNEGDLFLIERALKKRHILNEIIEARDGVEALEYLSGKGKYGGRDLSIMPVVILLDLKMPRMDGLECLKAIRNSETTRLLPVVILTNSAEEIDIMESYKLGCNAYVRKPVDFERFAEAIKQLGLLWFLINEPPPVVRE